LTMDIGQLTLEEEISNVKSQMSNEFDLTQKLSSLEERILKLENSQLSNVKSQMELTNPDILLASGSASLSSLGDLRNLSNLSVAEASISGLLASYDLTISNIFKSLGKAILGETTIAGDLTVDGMFSISSNSINVVGTQTPEVSKLTSGVAGTGILFLQNSPLAQGLDIFNGKVTIDKDGNLFASSITVDQIKINSGKSIGSGIIPKGSTEVVIENELVEENSLIFISPTISLSQRPAITQKEKGKFTVSLLKTEPEDINFNYFIVGTQPN